MKIFTINNCIYCGERERQRDREREREERHQIRMIWQAFTALISLAPGSDLSSINPQPQFYLNLAIIRAPKLVADYDVEETWM